LNDQSCERAEELLQSLLDKDHTLLAGMMLADGIGTEKQMASWAAAFARRLRDEWPSQIERCLRAWQASRQEERRGQLTVVLRAKAFERDWLAWLRLKQALEGIGDNDEVPVQAPESAVQAPIIAFSPSREIRSAKQFAGARAVSGIDQLWPGYPAGLLHLWPSERRRLALDLQRLASLGEGRQSLTGYLRQRHDVQQKITSQEKEVFAREIARVLSIYLTSNYFFNLDLALARALARARALEVMTDYLGLWELPWDTPIYCGH
jgi:hypothetical protein